MKISETFRAFGHFELWLLIIGLALLAATVIPRFLSRAPMSVAALLLGLGVLANVLGLPAPDPFAHGDYIEHVTELGVIIALMTAGLRIDRRPGLKRWAGTWATAEHHPDHLRRHTVPGRLRLHRHIHRRGHDSKS